MKIKFHILIFVILAGLTLNACQTKKTTPEPNLFDSFVQDDYTTIQLTADWDQVIADEAETGKFAADIEWQDVQGQSEKMQIKLEPRGKTRLNYCAFPPLKLIFSKEDMEERGLNGARKLKLVSHCNGDESLVLREYLAYKMYQELTEKSFLVQLVKITYTDSQGQQPDETHWGFILENHNDMAQRLNAKIMSSETTRLKNIDGAQYRSLALFQYMIGNTDWNMNLHHNIKLIQEVGRPCPSPIPYDFDYSGLVNAPYAIPHPMLPVNDVQDRYFQWRGKDVAAFEQTVQHFLESKSSLLDLTQNFTYLSASERQEIIQYMEAFYQKIEGLDWNHNDLVSVLNDNIDLS
ncbi:MAG: hypothetical protein DHS20C18_27180 [Saprospiraceae bacterium]|nr:MAG: hypothetical protein DHS20C18_27180 [Saprospiraceae bacterium]